MHLKFRVLQLCGLQWMEWLLWSSILTANVLFVLAFLLLCSWCVTSHWEPRQDTLPGLEWSMEVQDHPQPVSCRKSNASQTWGKGCPLGMGRLCQQGDRDRHKSCWSGDTPSPGLCALPTVVAQGLGHTHTWEAQALWVVIKELSTRVSNNEMM